MISRVDSWPRRGSASSNSPMVRKPSFRNGRERGGTAPSMVLLQRDPSVGTIVAGGPTTAVGAGVVARGARGAIANGRGAEGALANGAEESRTGLVNGCVGARSWGSAPDAAVVTEGACSGCPVTYRDGELLDSADGL